MSDMSDNLRDDVRRASDNWDRQERLVLKTLEDLRLSSDAALKIGGELKESFSTLRVEVKATVELHQLQISELRGQISELRGRLDAANKWLAGIAGSLIVGVILFLINQFHMVPK